MCPASCVVCVVEWNVAEHSTWAGDASVDVVFDCCTNVHQLRALCCAPVCMDNGGPGSALTLLAFGCVQQHHCCIAVPAVWCGECELCRRLTVCGVDVQEDLRHIALVWACVGLGGMIDKTLLWVRRTTQCNFCCFQLLCCIAQQLCVQLKGQVQGTGRMKHIPKVNWQPACPDKAS
jgi:hypothetical protein